MSVPRNLDVDLLRTFVSVVELGGFTRAAYVLLRRQSTLSLQIKRLEEAVGHRLLARTGRLTRPTMEGAAILPLARQMLDINDQVLVRLDEHKPEQIVRLKAPEDFAMTFLPEIVRRFAKFRPGSQLEVTCDLTMNLMNRFRRDELDVVLIRREPDRTDSGVRLWREPLVWVAPEGAPARRGDPLQLALSPAPCILRKRATEALTRARMAWSIAYSSASLASQNAAVCAGVGVSVLPVGMVPPGLAMVAPCDGLPNLRDVELALLAKRQLSPHAKRLYVHVARSLDERGATRQGAATLMEATETPTRSSD